MSAWADERKVRTPPGRVLGNTQAGRPDGKCHRNKPPGGCWVLGVGRVLPKTQHLEPDTHPGKGEMVR